MATAAANVKQTTRGKPKADNTPAAGGAGGAVVAGEEVLNGEVIGNADIFARFESAAKSLSTSGAAMDSCIRIMWTSVVEGIKAGDHAATEAAFEDVKTLNRLFADLVAAEKDSIGDAQQKNSLQAAMTSYKAKMVHESTKVGFTITSKGVTAPATRSKNDESGFERFQKGDLICPSPDSMKLDEFISGSFVAWKAPTVEKTEIEKQLLALKKLYETQAWAAKMGLPVTDFSANIEHVRAKIERLGNESGEQIVIPDFTKSESKEAVATIAAFFNED